MMMATTKIFNDDGNQLYVLVWVHSLEAGLHRAFWEKVVWKYAANLQENTHAKVRFQ